METAAVSFAGGQEGHPNSGFSRAAWFVVWMAMLGTLCCSTSVVLINVGVFMKPLAGTFGWSRGDIALSLSIGALSMAAANPFVGRLIDYFGVRPVLIVSLIGYGAATAAMPLMVQVGGISGLYFGYALIAGVGAGSNVIAYVRVLSGWFSDSLNSHRGLALGISSSGVPLGTAITSPLAVLLIEHFGWRAAYWGLAVLPIFIGLPIAIFAIRVAPGESGARARQNEDKNELPGLSVTQALGTRAFWLMMGIVFLMSSCLQGISIHTAPLLTDFGLSQDGLALVLAISGALGIAGRVGTGYLFDRFFAPWVSVGIFGIAAAASFALVGLPGLLIAVLATMLVFVGSGAESDFVGYLVGRYFGLRSYGVIFGAIYAVFMIGIAAGPYLMGVGFDHFGDYKIPFAFAGLGLALLCVLLVMLPRFEAEVELAAAQLPAA